MDSSPQHPILQALTTHRFLGYIFNWCDTLRYEPSSVIRQLGNYLAQSSHQWVLSRNTQTQATATEQVELQAIVWPTKLQRAPFLFFGPLASTDNLSLDLSLSHPAHLHSPVFLVKTQRGEAYAVSISSLNLQLFIRNPSLTNIPLLLEVPLIDGTHLLADVSSSPQATPASLYNIGPWTASATLTPRKIDAAQIDSPIVPVLNLSYNHPVHGTLPAMCLCITGALSSLTHEDIHQGFYSLQQAFLQFLQHCETISACATAAGVSHPPINYRNPDAGLKAAEIQAEFRFVLQHNPEIIQYLKISLEQPTRNNPHSRLLIQTYRDIPQGQLAHRNSNSTERVALSKPIRNSASYLFTDFIEYMRQTVQAEFTC